MSDEARVRELLNALDRDTRDHVYAVFADEIERGWIPKPADVEAVIRLVRAARG